MRISFVLPCSGRYPIGGFRIIYEYANRLVTRGHQVTLVHLIAPQPERLSSGRYWRARLQFIRDRLMGTYLPHAWFNLDARVATTCCFTLSGSSVPDGDAVIASAWHTAEGVARLGPETGRKFYFIQHYETWDSDHASLVRTWHLPLRKIVIATWLRDIAFELGETAAIVPNAVDYDFFRVEISPEQRPPESILMQCHRLSWKGTMDAVEALKKIRSRGIPFRLTLFGLTRPEELGIDLDHHFIFNPSQTQLKKLYNENAIFIAPSWSEGWGLTPHEAAACGAALAVTDIGGHREFLVPEETALMSNPKEPNGLAMHVERLLIDCEFRVELARRAAQSLSVLNWAHSVSKFEEVLQNGTG